MALTFVNQVGAIGGLNQAAPGSFIPEDFVRWSQDILFDRVGYLRRRAPYKTVPLYSEDATSSAQPNVAGERVLGVVTARNPANKNRIGIIVSNGSNTRILFYDDQFRKTCFCDIDSVAQDTIMFSRPALDGGVFIGLLESYGSIITETTSQNKNLLYYWRGGTGTGGYAINDATLNITNADIITSNYFQTGSPSNRFETSTAHNLAVNYVITVTTTAGAFNAGDTLVVTTINSDTEFLAVRLDPAGSLPNSNISGVNFIVAGHVTHTNTITGTFDPSKITPGMFAYRVEGGTYSNNSINGGTDHYLGIVKSVSTTTVTLEKDIIRTYGLDTSPYGRNTSQQVRFVNIRPYIHNHGRGLITKTPHGFTVTSGVVGSEGEGHFASAGLADSPGWALYRASDGAWLGDVESVTNNAALSLDNVYHTDSIAMNADEYVARPYRAVYKGNDADKYTGCFNTTYAGYQWFGNGGVPGTENRIVFSSDHDPESVDLSKDAADSIIIPGTQQMRGIATSSSGLVVFLEDKTYIIRGNYRSNFSLEELYPEGCLSAQSIVEYGGGVFWAAKNGLLFYDGASVRNLTENNLGSYYTDSIKTFNANERAIHGFFYKDYLFMTFTGFSSSYQPKRYEPLYATDYLNSPEGFTREEIQFMDSSFSNADFDVNNNVPIYWKPYTMYSSEGLTQDSGLGLWSAGISLVNATTTINSPNITVATTNGTADTTADRIIVNSHYLTNNTIIQFSNLNDVTGLSINTDYYIVNATSDTFQVSATLNGTPIVLTSSGTDLSVEFVNMDTFPVNNYITGPGIPAGSQVDTIISATQFSIKDGAGSPINATASGTVTLQSSLTAPTNNVWDQSLQFVWGPINFIEGITFAIYLPTNAITTISNFDFRGFIKLDSVAKQSLGAAAINAVNPDSQIGTYARLIDVDSMLDPTENHRAVEDSELSENTGKQLDLYYKGPDFYLQTKHYPVGDPVLKKWFRQIMINLFLLDGGVRMDVVDMEDNDDINILKKRNRNWSKFDEAGYSWREWENRIVLKQASPNKPLWNVVQTLQKSWYALTTSEFERRSKKISWRYPSAGFRLYQMNNYRPRNYQTPKKPHTIKIDAWNIGFKPLRKSRV